MIVAPVSLPPCQSPADPPLYTKKRASVHYPDDSTLAKRLSLHFGPRGRSFSESFAFTSTVVPEFPEKCKPQEDDPVSAATTPAASMSFDSTSSSCSSSARSSTSPFTSSSITTDTTTPSSTSQQADDEPNQELLKTLASFLRGEGNAQDSFSTSDNHNASTSTTRPRSAGPTGVITSSASDLVITVRDYAYPKTHPYHLGQYPPEPAYEASDVDEDEEMYHNHDDDDSDIARVGDEEDRTQGHARGLYDFDAENSSELSFKEGDTLWIHCRQFPGWFLGEMEGHSGLVPENYVQLL